MGQEINTAANSTLASATLWPTAKPQNVICDLRRHDNEDFYTIFLIDHFNIGVYFE